MNHYSRSKSKVLIVDLSAIVMASGLLSVLFAQWLYPLLGLPSTAPMPGRSLVILIMLWLIIMKRGEPLADFGLNPLPPIWRIILLAIVLLAAKLFIVQPVADIVAGFADLPKSDHSFFNHIHGNFPALIGWLAIAWVIGGFAEEFIFRGFLMRRVADVFNRGKLGWTIALLAQAILFGALHYYLGPAGVVSATLTALFYGLFFILVGRSLWPVMIAHATWDSLAFTLIYLNGVPST